MSDYRRLAVDIDGALAKVGLDRPGKLNPIDRLTLEELVRVADELDRRDEVRVAVFYGNGRSFSAGADLADFAALMAGGAERADEIRESAVLGQRMADAVANMRAVTVASVHGHVVGGGFVLMAACDLRVACDDTIMSIPEVDLGIPLTWGAVPRLVSELGASRARELVMTCRPFGPGDVPGFVHRVAPADEMARATRELVELLLDKPALALAMTKRQFHEVARDPVATAAADPERFVEAVMDPGFAARAARYVTRRR